jgi:hypothetical protein
MLLLLLLCLLLPALAALRQDMMIHTKGQQTQQQPHQ